MRGGFRQFVFQKSVFLKHPIAHTWPELKVLINVERGVKSGSKCVFPRFFSEQYLTLSGVEAAAIATTISTQSGATKATL